MISDLDETIRQILIRDAGLDPVQIDISFEIPNREWSVGISRPTLNCYLFDIRENMDLRQQGWQSDSQPSGARGQRYAVLRYNLTYLITAWTRAVEDEHRLLWRALQALSRHGALPGALLQGELRAHELPIYTTVARPDAVLKSPGEFWTALENQIKPSLSYTVVVAMDRDLIPSGPPVLSALTRVQTPDGALSQMVSLGGHVRSADGAPIVGALVTVEGRGARAQTDTEGRYVLPALTPGRYTLVVDVQGHQQRREVDIPAAVYDFSFGTTESV